MTGFRHFLFTIIKITIALYLLASCNSKDNSGTGQLYEFHEGTKPRWSSFENITAEKGKGGMENYGAKGHPYDELKAGQSKILLDVKGPGVINRMWITIMDRSPEMLRSLKLEIFWDDEVKPAVAVPFGDFFSIGLGKTAKFDNSLFASPEGRSFNCFIPMPFKKAAKIKITNESKTDLWYIFFDVNYQELSAWDDKFMYFHSYWNRDTLTTLGKDFELLPNVTGKGKFLGVNVGVNGNPIYKTTWWGEGEVKTYLDGDKEFPTLIGTGTEDYIGTAWGQGTFCNDYTGCLIANDTTRQWAFYRFHIPDPIFFESACKVTLQQIGGDFKPKVIELQKEKIPIIPVSIGRKSLYKKDSLVDLSDTKLPDGWTNFYRSDDVSSTAYFYLNSPKNDLPELQSLAIRTYNLKNKLPSK